MLRRMFVRGFAMSSSAIAVATSSDTTIVTYHIKGFTCITCAVGLDTLMAKEPGVISIRSSYSAATTTIRFNPSQTSERSLKQCISEMGFKAD